MKKITYPSFVSSFSKDRAGIPCIVFIVAVWLNYALGLSPFRKVIEPIFEKRGNNQFGFNINLLILVGPMLSIPPQSSEGFAASFASGSEELNVDWTSRGVLPRGFILLPG